MKMNKENWKWGRKWETCVSFLWRNNALHFNYLRITQSFIRYDTTIWVKKQKQRWNNATYLYPPTHTIVICTVHHFLSLFVMLSELYCIIIKHQKPSKQTNKPSLLKRYLYKTGQQRLSSFSPSLIFNPLFWHSRALLFLFTSTALSLYYRLFSECNIL